MGKKEDPMAEIQRKEFHFSKKKKKENRKEKKKLSEKNFFF